MHRRQFIVMCPVAIAAGLCSPAMAANRRFVFKIKTKGGGIIGNIVIEAKDMEAAKYKLRQRYPGCEILEGEEK